MPVPGRRGDDGYLFAALLANLLPETVRYLFLQVRHVLEHVAENNDLAHLAKLALVLALALAAEDLASAAGLGPAVPVRIRLPAALFDLDAERVDNAGLVRAQARALGPAILAHEAMGKAGLARSLGARGLHRAVAGRAVRRGWVRGRAFAADAGTVGLLVADGLSRYDG